MAYDINLSDRVRAFFAEVPNIGVVEKEMLAVFNFLVNGKTCVCVSVDKTIKETVKKTHL